MTQMQAYDKCDHFGNRYLCPHIKDEAMKHFVADSDTPQSNVAINQTELYERDEEINKLFCNKCLKFSLIK